MLMSVFVSVFICDCLSASSLRNYTSSLFQISDACGMLPVAMAWTVLLLRRCDTLCTTSGFMNDVMFAHNGQQ